MQTWASWEFFNVDELILSLAIICCFIRYKCYNPNMTHWNTSATSMLPWKNGFLPNEVGKFSHRKCIISFFHGWHVKWPMISPKFWCHPRKCLHFCPHFHFCLWCDSFQSSCFLKFWNICNLLNCCQWS